MTLQHRVPSDMRIAKKEPHPFRRTLSALAIVLAAASMTTGCFDSDNDPVLDSGNDPVVPDEPGNGDTGNGDTSAFAVDFGVSDLVQPNWGDPKTITAFRPGQASFQYLDEGAHSGAGALAAGCAGCHATPTNPPQVGAIFDSEEPTPSKETVDITVQAAYDAEKFFLKASWDTPRPGISHDLWQFNGTGWDKVDVENKPGAQADEAAGERFSAEDRLALMFMPKSQDISTGSISFHEGGCFAACHDDMTDMPENPGGKVSKYLVSGTSTDGANSVNSETNAMVLDGSTDNYPDMWHFRGARSAIINTLTDGYVMDTRASDDSPNFYDTQSPDDGKGGIRWMYDPQWLAGFVAEFAPDFQGDAEVSAISDELWDALGQNAPTLVVEGPQKNAIVFDSAAVNEGDILPRRILFPPDGPTLPADGSRTDVTAYSKWQDGTWTVIFERARVTGNEEDHDLNMNEEYSFAFAAHQNNTAGRWHHVTFPVTLGMEGSGADIEAKQNN